MATTNANHTTALNLYDAVGDQIVAARATNVSTANGETYGDLIVSATVTATNPSVGTDSAAVPGSETLIGAKDGSGNLKPAQTDGTNLLVKDANSAAAKADLDTIVTNTTGLATQATLLAVKVDLDTLVLNTADLLVDGDNLATIVTNTGNIPAKGTAVMAGSTPVTIATNDTVFAEVLTDLDNLATIQTNTANIPAKGQTTMSASTPVALASDQTKIPTKAASGDFAANSITDLATLLTLSGTSADANTVNSFMGRFTKIRDLLSVLASSVASADGQSGANVPLEASGVWNGTTIDRWKSLITGVGAVGGAYTEQASLSAGSLNADLVASMDVSAYKWLSLHINANAYSGTLSFQGSNDNVTFTSINLGSTANIQPVSTTTSTGNIYYGPVYYRYLRIRMTSYASGAAQGTLELYTQPGGIWNTNASASQSGTWSLGAATTGGTSDFHLISAASTNAANIKNAAGQIYGYEIGNNGASDAYVKLYNASSAPTAGSGTPFRVIYIPKGSRAQFHSSTGLAMGTGIGLTITGGAADNDTTAVGAAQVTVEIDYK